MNYYVFVYRITDKMFQNTPLAILVWAIGGTYIVHLSNLTINSDVWFWFFSTIAQTFAALIALIVTFYFFGIKLVTMYLQLLSEKNQLEEVDNSVIEQQMDNFKIDIKKLLITALFIVMISIILLPFGSPKIENKYLFSWDEIPGNDDERIIEYLKDELKIEWAKTENIGKIDDGKTIIVSNNENSLSLKLNDEKTKVNLKIDDGRVDEFTVKTENGKLNIYENNWLLEILNTYKLKCITLFGVIGLCVSSLYNMAVIFKKFLEEEWIQK